MRKAITSLILLGLAGCASTPAPIDVRVECQPLRTWTPAEQAGLAIALGPIPSESPIWTLSRDWEQMRAAIRACTNSKNHP